MDESIEITQRAMPGAGGQLVGVQNNYHGLTPEEASKLALNLFMDNFPKLQAIAADTAKRRAEELTQGVIKRLEKENIRDFSAFTDPDTQYVIWEAQKSYARFGETESFGVLTDLITTRVLNDSRSNIKRITDTAILVAGELSSTQLDCLTVLFLLTQVRFCDVVSIDSLQAKIKDISDTFCARKLRFGTEVSYLLTKGCLELSLPDIIKISARTYNLDDKEVMKVIPGYITQYTGDYGVSKVGMMIAIANANSHALSKPTSQWHNVLDPHIWIEG